MLAHYHAQTWNGAELARALGVSESTVRRYLDLLTGVFMLRQLPPWFENLSKRQVKAPKLYLRDSGILHLLLEIPDEATLLGHPRLGASFEGFLIESLLDHLRTDPGQAFFWRTQRGAELDLLVVRGRERLGFEVKYTSAPGLTPSMRTALTDLKLDRLDVLHAGKDTYPLAPRVRAVALCRLLRDVSP